MTEDEAIAELDRIAVEHADDPERAHQATDAVLIKLVTPGVSAAHARVMAAVKGWWFA